MDPGSPKRRSGVSIIDQQGLFRLQLIQESSPIQPVPRTSLESPPERFESPDTGFNERPHPRASLESPVVSPRGIGPRVLRTRTGSISSLTNASGYLM